MKKQILQAFAAAVLVGALPVAAFAQNAAIVNGKPVPKARMDVLAQQLAAAGRPVTPEMQDQLREEVVAREVFMQEAHKQGLDASDHGEAAYHPEEGGGHGELAETAAASAAVVAKLQRAENA